MYEQLCSLACRDDGGGQNREGLHGDWEYGAGLLVEITGVGESVKAFMVTGSTL